MRQLAVYARKPAFWGTLIIYLVVAFWLLSRYCFGEAGVQEEGIFCPVGIALIANAFAGAVLIGQRHRAVASALAICFLFLIIVYIVTLVV
jgi:hypothetical protein